MQPWQPWGARRLRRFSLRWRLDAFSLRWRLDAFSLRWRLDAYSLRRRLDPSLGAGTPPCIYVPSAAWILQTLLTRARTAPVFLAPILAADAAQQVTQFRPWSGTPVGCGAFRRGGDLTPSVVTGPFPCIHVPAAAWILQTLLTRARTAPMSVVPIPAANAA